MWTALLSVAIVLGALFSPAPGPRNLPPIANDDSVTVVVVPAYVDIPILKNDFDPEGRPLTVTELYSAQGSRAVLIYPGTIRVYLAPSQDPGAEGFPEDPTEWVPPTYLLAQGSYIVSDGVNTAKAMWAVYERPQ